MALDDFEAPTVGKEVGSAFDRDRVFSSWDEYKVIDPLPVEADDMSRMLKVSGKAASLEEVLTLPIRSLGWTIKPAKGDSGELDLVNEALTTPFHQGGMKTPIGLVIGQLAAARIYRVAYMEKVWRAIESGATGQTQIAYEKLGYRPPSTCRLIRDPDNADLLGFRQWAWKDDLYKEVDILGPAAFVFIHGQHRDPLHGVSDLESAYAIWQDKQKLKWLWFDFLQLQGLPKLEANTTRGDEDTFARKVATIRGGDVIGTSEGQSIKPIVGNDAGAQLFRDALDYLDQEMAVSVLAGFVDLPSAANRGTGSYALSESQSQFFLKSSQGVAKEIAAAITHQLIAPLVVYNFPGSKAFPTFEFGPLDKDSQQKSSDMLKALAAGPNLKMPTGFLDLLIEQTASYLDLPPDKVAKQVGKVEYEQKQPPPALAAGPDGAVPPNPISSAVRAASDLVAKEHAA